MFFSCLETSRQRICCFQLFETVLLCRLRLTSCGELLKVKFEKQGLREGLLLEYKKDSERVLLAVAQKPDGKKNWIVSDQVSVK